MNRRRIAWIAMALALLVQAGFVVAYRALMAGWYAVAPSYVFWFVGAAAQPLVRVTGGLGQSHGDAAAWNGIFLFAAINAVFWFAAVVVLLNGLVLLFRVRAADTRPRSHSPVP